MRRSQSRGSTPELTISEAIDFYIGRKRPNWKGETERTYRRNLEKFELYADKSELDSLADLDRWNIQGFRDYLVQQDYARATIAGRQKTVKTWLKYLGNQGLIPTDLYRAIETIQLTEDEETSDQQLTPEDAQALLSFYRQSTKWRGTRRHAILEVLWHIGCRMCGLRALDLDDYDPNTEDLKFRNRPETDTRLKRGNTHERNVTLSEEPKKVLNLYIGREREDTRDEYGRKPLFPSQQGRPTGTTIRGWMYEATQPCMASECPHGKRRPNCEYVPRDSASRCPSTRSPHAIRRGSITWQRNLDRDIEKVAKRTAATPNVIRRYYDDPDYDDELERRRMEIECIDIEKHLHPSDLVEEENEEDQDRGEKK